MKLAVTIASEEAKASAFVVWRGFEQSMEKAARCGYHGVELALKNAGEIEPSRLRKWLKTYDLAVSCITTGQVFADLGLYFTHSEKAVRQQAASLFLELIDLASEFGGMVNIGRARGFLGEGRDRTEAVGLFCEVMERIAPAAREKGVTLVLEPVNRYESDFINSLDEGACLLERCGFTDCGLMPDVFHMNLEDDRIGESLVRNARWIRYIHLADSNRKAPGMGHLDFREVFRALERIGYEGWASVEILPENDPDTAARRAIEYLAPLLAAYGKGGMSE